MIYLDNAATSFPKPEPVYEALGISSQKPSWRGGNGRGSYEPERPVLKKGAAGRNGCRRVNHGNGF